MKASLFTENQISWMGYQYIQARHFLFTVHVDAKSQVNHFANDDVVKKLSEDNERVWSFLPVSAQYQKIRLEQEPEARLSDISRAGVEFADHTKKAA